MASRLEELQANLQGLRAAVASILEADEGGDGAAVAAKVLDAKALFVQLRMQSRDLHLELDATKNGVRAATNALDAHNLSLQNQRYEESHLHREISSCEGFPTPLTAQIEALIAPANGATRQAAKGVDAIAAAHQQKMEHFSAEYDERKRLRATCEDLRVRKKAAIATNRRQRDFIAGIPATLAAMSKSSEPLQAYLSLDVSKSRAAQREARALPPALYVLYNALSGYCEAQRDGAGAEGESLASLAVDIVEAGAERPPVKRARAALAAAMPPLPQLRRADGAAADEGDEDDAADSEDDSARGAAAHESRRGSSSSSSPASASTSSGATTAAQAAKGVAASLLECGGQAVRFAIALRAEGGRPARTFEVIFSWLPSLGVVAARSATLDLASLYVGDTGASLPAAASQKVCAACAACEPHLTPPSSSAVARLLVDALGAPLRWAQWLGGSYTRPERAAAEAETPFTRATAAALVERCISTAALEPLLEALALCPPIVPVPSGLPAVGVASRAAPASKLIAWQEVAGAIEQADEVVGGRSFRATFSTSAGAVRCAVWLAPEFPLCGARLALSSGSADAASGGGAADASPLRADLLSLQADLNGGFGELQRQLAEGGHDAVQLLAVQLRLAQAQLDVVAQGNSAGSGAPRRGRDRRLA
jgi:hypothetical protein